MEAKDRRAFDNAEAAMELELAVWEQLMQTTRDSQRARIVSLLIVCVALLMVTLFMIDITETLVDLGQDTTSFNDLRNVRRHTDRRDVLYTQNEVTRRMKTSPLRIQQVSSSSSSASLLWSSPSSSLPSAPLLPRWMEIEEALFDLYRTLNEWKIAQSEEEGSIEAQSRLDARRGRCLGQTDVERISDPDCRVEWMASLASSKIVGVEGMLGFGRGKKGALKVRLQDGREGWYKPCGGSGEGPEKEVFSSALDWVLGWNRVVPVISRNVTFQELHDAILSSPPPPSRSWLDLSSPLLDRRLLIAHQTLHSCSYDGGTFSGAMIGWWGHVAPARTFAKAIKFGITENEIEHQLRPHLDHHFAAAITQNHFFFYLIDVLRPIGYNEYQTLSHPFDQYPMHLFSNQSVSHRAFALSDRLDPSFPSHNERQREVLRPMLIALDLDRASLDDFRTTSNKRLSACMLCRVWKSTYQQLEQIKNNLSGFSHAVQLVCSVDPNNPFLFRSQVRTLEDRLKDLFDCVQSCIDRYGMDQVIVDDLPP